MIATLKKRSQSLKQQLQLLHEAEGAAGTSSSSLAVLLQLLQHCALKLSAMCVKAQSATSEVVALQ
jgi:hypothetical protein